MSVSVIVCTQMIGNTHCLTMLQFLSIHSTPFLRQITDFAGTEITGVCRNRGAVGGLQALTALEAHFARVSLQALPAQGGFHAAYSGSGSVYAFNEIPYLTAWITMSQYDNCNIKNRKAGSCLHEGGKKILLICCTLSKLLQTMIAVQIWCCFQMWQASLHACCRQGTRQDRNWHRHQRPAVASRPATAENLHRRACSCGPCRLPPVYTLH